MDNALIKDENLMIFHPKLAELLGLNESIILNQIHYWLNKSNNIIDGKPWIYNSYEAWHKQIKFLSTSTIKKAIRKLETMKIILCNNFNKCKMDKTKWYTIDYNKLQSFFEEHKNIIDEKEQSTDINNPIHDKNMQCSGLKLTEGKSNSDKAIPEITTETTHSDDNDIRQGGANEKVARALNLCMKESSKGEEDLNIMLKENNSFKEIIDFYTTNISLPGGYELEKLKYFLEEFKDPELIIFAMAQAISGNARNLRYIEKVLYNWLDNGIKNKSEAEAFTESYKKYKEDKGYGGFTGDLGKNKCGNSKITSEHKWTGYKPPEPRISTASDGQGLI